MADDLNSEATALGIELGSTRVKAVLVGPEMTPIASGSHEWAAHQEDGLWTYSLDSVWNAIQAAYRDLVADVQTRYEEPLSRVGAVGISAMMHGYLPFDDAGELLTPFRTWQNTNTTAAVSVLTESLGFNMPLRWSAAHLYQAVLDDEPHVGAIDFLTTLAGYVHWQLSGERVLGVGDASGMFPIDSLTGGYDQTRLATYDRLLADRGLTLRLADLLPRPLTAGQAAGRLTEAGARLLDPTGTLAADVPMAPPEGDAGTGMVATNSVAPRTANVSVGTSIFAMVVLDQDLVEVHPEIDLVTTPDGHPTAMVHCNNGASDLALWVRLLGEAASLLGAEFSSDELYRRLYQSALDARPDAGGVLAYNFLVGEPVVGVEQGGPAVVRLPGADFTLANFMRANFYGAFAALRIGMDILTRAGIRVDVINAHGGLFRTEAVAQQFLAAALNSPVSVGDTAGEGGAWGMALLAAFAREKGTDLAGWLGQRVFDDASISTSAPDPQDVSGFQDFLEHYRSRLLASC